LGKASGRVGNVVVRDFGYDQFISVRPDRYKIKRNFKEVNHKLHFYYSMKITKSVFKFPEIKEAWNNSNMPGKRGYNRMITANIALLKDNLPSIENIITPKGRALFFDITEQNEKGIKFSFGMAGLIKPPFTLTIIFMLFNPIESPTGLCEMSGCRYFFNPELADKIKNIKENGKYDFDHCFCDILKFHMTRFKQVILYAAVVGTPTVKGKAWWTSTVAMDLSKKE
jgi:hypothetical protein